MEEALPATSPSDTRIAALRRRLLAWYRREKRDLPWRRTRDPYRIWLSEIMLQQTRVDFTVPYYERFLGRFADVESLARAPLAAVLDAWAGLGYYSRARNLHAAAQRIVTEHRGVFPRRSGELEALPGIGRYTAGAVRSIAFGEPAPILDGNCVRVFARLFGFDADVDSSASRRQLWTWATLWAAGTDPGAANQALMELGAMICTKPVPRCEICPLSSACVAHRTGRERDLPRPRSRPAPERVVLQAVLASQRGRLLLVRRSSGKLLRDWWELPACRANDNPRDRTASTSQHAIAGRLREQLGIDLGPLRPVGAVWHGILSHRLDMQVFTASARHSGTRRPSRRPGAARTRVARSFATLDHDALEARWVSSEACCALPLSTLTRKALRAAATHDPGWSAFLPRARADPPALREGAPGGSTGAGGAAQSTNHGLHSPAQLAPRAPSRRAVRRR